MEKTMKDLAGEWTYRSFLNDPQPVTTPDEALSLIFGEGGAHHHECDARARLSRNPVVRRRVRDGVDRRDRRGQRPVADGGPRQRPGTSRFTSRQFRLCLYLLRG